MPIPINIDDTTVLRRTLEEFENRLPKLSAPLSNVDEVRLDGTNDTQLLADKVNEIVKAYNSLVTELNITAKHRI